MKSLIIWGATGQAKVLWEFVCRQYQIIGLVDRDIAIKSPFENVPIYHSVEQLKRGLTLRKNETIYFAVAIGGIYRGKDRWQIHQDLLNMGLLATDLIHPDAYIASTAKVAAGNQILAKSVVCAEAQIGEGCIVNTSATVDHETVLGHGVHICPGAHLLGNVRVGDYATIGAGAVVVPHIIIGEGAVIGAGSIVLKDVPPYAVVVGNPGKIIKYVQKG